MDRFTTIDAHCGGAPLRLLIGGAPTPRGRTMGEKTAWMARHGDDMRRTLMLEPRGHRDMTGALLTEPVEPGSHAGLIFMNADGYVPFAGHAVMAATTLALHRGLVVPRGGGAQTLVYDTVAGTVRARPTAAEGGRDSPSVTLCNMPSFVLRAGLAIRASGRHIRVDVAFGGSFYAIVDAESAGVGVDLSHLTALRQVAADVIDAVEGAIAVVHPLDSKLRGLAGILFTAPPGAPEAQLKSVAVRAGGSAGRGPSASGMSAVMAVLDAMGLLAEDVPFRQEGLSRSCFSGRIGGRTRVGELPAIVPEISGSTWMTGEQVLCADPRDPFSRGLPG